MGQLDQSFMVSPYNNLGGTAIDKMFLEHPDYKPKDKTTILCILASCWDAYSINKKNNIWVSLSFSNDHYTAYPDYSIKHWTRSRVRSAFQYLRDNKLINKMPSIAPKRGYAGKRTRVKISPALMKIFTDPNLEIYKIRLNKPQVLIRQNKKDSSNLNVNQSRLVKPPITNNHYIKVINDVSVINEELLKHNFGLPSSISESSTPLQGQKYHYPISFNDLFQNRLKIRLQRLFSDVDLTKHGRYYTTLQSLRSEYRQFLTIDGDPVVEVDYRGLHYNIAYNRNDLDMTEYPYQHQDIPKEIFKQACIIALNTKNKRSASGAIRNLVEDPDLDQKCRGFTSKEVLQAVIDKHPAIEGQMFHDYGLEYMNIDSNIATEVIKHFVELGEGILPIHDSFVVRKTMQQELIEVMNHAYKNHLNYEPFELEVKIAA